MEAIKFHDGSLDAAGIFDGEEVKIEVETKGSKFFTHGHDQDECGLVICWENNRTSDEVGGIESREWKGKSDHPAVEDVDIEVLKLQGLGTISRRDCTSFSSTRL